MTWKNFRIFFCAFLTLPAWAKDYYIASSGNGLDGLSPASAFKTLDRLSTLQLRPGDQVLLQAGETFTGSIVLTEKDAGDPLHPVRITSFGTGRATLRPGAGFGILVRNTSGVEITDLNIDALQCEAFKAEPDHCRSGPVCQKLRGNGIALLSDRENDGKPEPRFSQFVLRNLLVRGFASDKSDRERLLGNGVLVRAEPRALGFRSILIDSVQVSDNAQNGIYLDGGWRSERPGTYGLQDVEIRNSEAFFSTGVPGLKEHSGSGIVLAGAENGRILQSSAHHNGCLNGSKQSGPAGIWTYNSAKILIEKNHSWQNRTASRTDGGGFDADGATRQVVLRKNFSQENDGPGYLLAQFPGAEELGPNSENVVEENVSVNDGLKNQSAAIYLWSAIDKAQIRKNRVLLSRSPAAAFKLHELSGEDVHVSENEIWLESKNRLLQEVGENRGLQFKNNRWSTCEGGLRVSNRERQRLRHDQMLPVNAPNACAPQLWSSAGYGADLPASAEAVAPRQPAQEK